MLPCSRAQEMTRADTKRILALQAERDEAVARADRAAATRAAQAERANALAARVEAAEDQLHRERLTLLGELEKIQAEVVRLQESAAQLQRERSQAVAELEQSLAAEREAHTRDVTQLQQALNEAHERANRNAVAATNAQNAVAGMQAELDALRTRLLEAATLQLAAEAPSQLVTGVRIVGLLGLRGFTARLLELIDHEDEQVVVAAARGLASAGDREKAALEASDAALALMADASIAVRMAGTELLRSVTGKTIEFDPGASAEKRAAALKQLRTRLGS